jgi:hypothetical protein
VLTDRDCRRKPCKKKLQLLLNNGAEVLLIHGYGRTVNGHS